MLNLRPNRAARRADRRHTAKKLLAMAGSAVTATALTAGVSAPAANAAVYNPDVTLAADTVEIPTIATGPLLGIVSALGIKSIPLLPGFALTTDWVESNPQNVYNALNAIPLAEKPASSAAPCGFSSTANCRVTPILASGFGAFGARDAVNAMWTAANTQPLFPIVGDPYDGTPNPGNVLDPGYSLLAGLKLGQSPTSAPVPDDTPSTTDVVSLLLNNPLRINGGIAARLAPLLSMAGIDSSFPVTGVNSNCGNGLTCDQYNTAAGELPDNYLFLQSNVIDLTWAYNPLADFPQSANPVSLINSLFAALPPTYLLTSGLDNFLQNAASVVGINGQYVAPGVDTALGTGLATYFAGSAAPANVLGTAPATFLTLKNDDLPILLPLRLPSLIINTVLDRLAAAFAPPGSAGLPFRLGTPIADMLQPALKILVNIGYSDVVTPTDVATNPDLLDKGYCALGGVCYDRTFAQSTSVNNTFSLMGNLTPQEMLQVPGDVLNALVTGITQQLAKPFFGIIEPAPCVGCAPTAAVAPAPSAALAAATEEPAGAPAAEAVDAEVSTVEATDAEKPAAQQVSDSAAADAAASVGDAAKTARPDRGAGAAAKAATRRTVAASVVTARSRRSQGLRHPRRMRPAKSPAATK